MKALARYHFWWPGVDEDITNLVKACQACQAVKQKPAVAPLHPWSWPAKPWQRVHIDFAGPFLGKSFFVAVDAHFKWAEVVKMPQTTTSRTIKVLHNLFSRYGLPEQIVSENEPQFTSEDFAAMKGNGVKHIRSAPYHPASNGAVERFIRTFKQAMKAGRNDGWSIQLENFLLSYRTTPHTTTNTSPSSLFLGRSIRTRLDLIQPNIERCVVEKQAIHKTIDRDPSP